MRTSIPAVFFCLLLFGASCDRHDGDDFSPTSPAVQGALMLAASAASIPADGFSRVVITAQIAPDADDDKRMVRLETTDGAFLGADADSSDKRKTLSVDTSGKAIAELRSSTDVKTVLITGKVLKTNADGTMTAVAGLVTQLSLEFTAPDPTAILKISASAASGEADGAGRILIHADVTPELVERTVKFATTLGMFVQGSNKADTAEAEADLSHRATVVLESPKTAGEARVTATVTNSTSDTTTAATSIRYDPAPPDTIRVKLGATELVRGGGGTEETTVEVFLERNPGRGDVTERTAVRYSAHAKSGGSLALQFRNQVPSDADGKATAMLRLGSVEFVGTATVRAEVEGVVGEEDIDIDAPAAEPEIGVAPNPLDFGDVAAGESLERILTVTNSGGAALVLSGISVTNAAFAVLDPGTFPVTVEAGASQPVNVRFSPTEAGAQSGDLQISSNDSDEGILTVGLTGTGT